MMLTQIQADEIRNYDWPGNVRELKNVIERAVILSQGTVLRLDLSLAATGAETVTGPQNDYLATESLILTEKDMKILQKKNLLAALRQTNWRVSGKGGAAELLGVRPTTLADRIKSFGVRKPRHS
jgi:transcriptional regulator with GAF, ATPase, and Fis domain